MMNEFKDIPIRLADALQKEPRWRRRLFIPTMPTWLLQVLSLLCWMLLGGLIGLMMLMLQVGR
jgi:hypothetical protein